MLRSLLKKDGDAQVIDRITDSIAAKAMKGDVHAFEAARDTTDGRPGPDSDVAAASTVFAPVFMSIADPGEK